MDETSQDQNEVQTNVLNFFLRIPIHGKYCTLLHRIDIQYTWRTTAHNHTVSKMSSGQSFFIFFFLSTCIYPGALLSLHFSVDSASISWKHNKLIVTQVVLITCHVAWGWQWLIVIMYSFSIGSYSSKIMTCGSQLCCLMITSTYLNFIANWPHSPSRWMRLQSAECIYALPRTC